MDLAQLRCFLAVAETLHFGQAARRLDLLPATLGRQIQALEEDLGLSLFLRTTRSVLLTEEGAALQPEATRLVAMAEEMAGRFRRRARIEARTLRLGAIDTAAAGLLPALLRDFQAENPGVTVELVEDRSLRLLPRLLSGRLDLAIARPPPLPAPRLDSLALCEETLVVALPTAHPRARRRRLDLSMLADEPLILPDRRTRPHSHDAVMRRFAQAGLRPAVAQIAGEKQTMLGLVAAGLGIALVPRWSARAAPAGLRFLPLVSEAALPAGLPLAALWLGGARDALRERMLHLLRCNLARYVADA